MAPLLKRLLNLILQLVGPRCDKSARGPRELAADQLEPRILYSAAPVEAPAAAEEAPAQEAPAVVEASGVTAAGPAPAVEAQASVPAPVDAAQEVELAGGEIAPTQGVELVDIDAGTAALNQETVETLAAEARQRWINSGISVEQIAALDSVSYDIADVGGAHLGVANGFSITIDDDAGGTGVGNWFIDTTPGDDVEFGGNASVSAANGRFDLLSTLIHEQGHVLGLGDLYGARTNVMGGFLDAGTRRLPVVGQAEGAVAAAIVGDNFLTANIVRASTDLTGAQAEGGGSFLPVLSADGRYVVFVSNATNLVPDDTNGTPDVFVKDLQTGGVTRVSTDSNGGQSVGGQSSQASISADGRYVAFTSRATNLVVGDTNGKDDIFVKDLQTGVTTRVSTSSSGAQTTIGFSGEAAISGNGRFVVFTSTANNLVADDNNSQSDIFRKDLKTGKTVRVSTDSVGGQSFGGLTERAAISSNGRYIAFDSTSAGLVEAGTGGFRQVYWKDVTTGKLIRLSTDEAGITGNEDSYGASISADGRRVVFYSEADNLIAGDGNGFADIFVRDLKAGSIGLVSSDSSGNQIDGGSFNASISADGNVVVFISIATDLGTSDTNGVLDVFVKNLNTGIAERVSTTATGGQVSDFSLEPTISADGRFVAFTSASADLVTGDSNGQLDVFVKGIDSLARTFTTSVEIDASGNLVIEDVDGGDTADNLFVGIKDGVLEISDKRAVIGSSIAGTTLVGSKGRGVSVGLGSFSGDIIIRTMGGDDKITLGDLSGLPGGVVVDGGDDHDLIKQKGVVTLIGAGAIDYQAESIRLERKSALMTAMGNIEVSANGASTSLKKSVGLTGRGGAIVNSVDGDIGLYGNGGSKGSGNYGIDLRNVEISSTTGDVSLTGAGGLGVSGNRGVFLSKAVITLGSGDLAIEGDGQGTGGGGNVAVTMARGTLLTVGGAGGITIQGDSSGMKSGNRGIVINSGVEIQTDAGDIGIVGTGGGYSVGSAYYDSISSNTGLQVGKAFIDSLGGGQIGLGGSGGGTGARSMGVILKGTGISTTHNSAGVAVSIGSQGSVIGEGSGNAGTFLSSVTISAPGNLIIAGVGGAGKNSNYGVRIANSTLLSDMGIVQLKGGSPSSVPQPATTGSSNFGVFVSNSQIEGFESASIEAYGNAGISNNFGARLVNSDLVSDAAGQGTVVIGISKDTTTGRNNRGIDAKGSNFAGKLTYLVSEGGSGTNNNEALKLNRSSVTALDGEIKIEAGGMLLLSPTLDINSVTTGENNRGADIRNSSLTASTDLSFAAASAGGTSNNVGLQSLNSTFAAGGILTVDVLGDANSTGDNNRGLYAKGGSFTGNVIGITAERGGGVNNNEALHLNGTSIIASAGLTVDAGTDNTTFTTGRNNFGAVLRNAVLSAFDQVDLTAVAGGGTRDNMGVKAVMSKITSVAGSVSVVGTSAGAIDARGATGIFLDRTDVSGKDDIVLSGIGGFGARDNRGLSVMRSAIVSANGNIDLDGHVSGATMGTGNVGLYLFNAVGLAADGSIDIDGTGGGGTGMNYGVFMDRNITAPGANVSGTATDGVSEDEAGDFFPV